MTKIRFTAPKWFGTQKFTFEPERLGPYLRLSCAFAFAFAFAFAKKAACLSNSKTSDVYGLCSTHWLGIFINCGRYKHLYCSTIGYFKVSI